jgi:Iron-sulfur cluster-binding domain
MPEITSPNSNTNRDDTALLDYNHYSCPLFHRVYDEAFIAPDRTWYACCFDSNNELVLGNVAYTSLHHVAQREHRKALIANLRSKQFKKIGGPCATVNCCQGISDPL